MPRLVRELVIDFDETNGLPDLQIAGVYFYKQHICEQEYSVCESEEEEKVP